MKGIIFTEFIELVEQTFSIDTAEEMIEQSNLPSGGAYTSVGTYSHEELLALIGNLSRLTGIPVPDLVMTFGEYLFRRFSEMYPMMFREITDPLNLLSIVEGHIHVEVKKLYPDAKLPSVVAVRKTDKSMELQYQSERPLAIVAEALIRGCFKFFGKELRLERIDEAGRNGCAALFRIEVLN